MRRPARPGWPKSPLGPGRDRPVDDICRPQAGRDSCISGHGSALSHDSCVWCIGVLPGLHDFFVAVPRVQTGQVGRRLVSASLRHG